MTAHPLDDIRDLFSRLPGPNGTAAEDLRRRLAEAALLAPASPAAAQAEWLAAWTGRARPLLRKPLVAIFAGTHGVASHGVSRTPLTATQAAVDACAKGQSPISKLCLEADLGLKIFDLALEMPTGDFTMGPALDERGCAATVAFGMEALADGTDALCLGAYGVGGSASASAILSALYPEAGHDWLPAPSQLVAERRAVAVSTALALHRPHLGDPLAVLQRLGGREFAAIAGAILAARFQSVPVVLDGPVVLAVAAVLHRAQPGSIAHCILAAPPLTDRLSRTAAEVGLTSVLGQSIQTPTRDPLDGAFALQRLKGIAALAA